MKTFLMVLFLINGQPTFLDGWMPLPMESPQACEEARQTFHERMKDESPYPYHLACYEQLPKGDPA